LRVNLRFVTATLQDATTLALAATAPYAVLNAVIESVFKAGSSDGTALANCPGSINTDTVGGEKDRWCIVPAIAVCHPRCG
jgi:hypothetical protein